MLVSEKADEDGEACEHGSSEIWSLPLEVRIVADCIDEHGQDGESEEDVSAVNADATDPLAEIVALGFEDKPLVSEKRNGDVDEGREHGGKHVTLRHNLVEKGSEEGKGSVGEGRVPDANQEITAKLTRRNVSRERGEG
jgi:hypothetical protein